MITFIKKKLSYIAIIFFIIISIKNLSKFNDIDMINIENDIDTSILANQSGDLSTQDELLEKDYLKLQKYELIKKSYETSDQLQETSESLNIANYRDLQSATDYFVDEKNMNLSLVPVNETMLFSGIPDPQSRPIPEKQAYFKATTITVQNKKSLKEGLAKFLDKAEVNFVKNYFQGGVLEANSWKFTSVFYLSYVFLPFLLLFCSFNPTLPLLLLPTNNY